MNKFQQNLPYTILLILILIVGSVYLFGDSMELYPAFVHSWTQSDRLAIAMNFQDNGFDFFHPATYNLLTKEGITQVDFPIHDYLVAVFSSIFQTDIIATFRYYNLIYALLGFFYLYRASFAFGGSAVRSILLVSFTATLPFFAFYQNGFLPSIPSYANFCIALYFLVNYYKGKRMKDFGISMIFFSLAALARIPFTIFLVAVWLERVYTSQQSKNWNWKELLFPALGLMAVVAYFLYNKNLAAEYGSMFLSQFRHPSSLVELIGIFQGAAERWKGQIFSPFHFVLLLLVVALLIGQRKYVSKKNFAAFPLKTITIISALGVVFYFLLMGLQFVDHDYYYIDSFLPLLTLGLIFAFWKIELSSKWYTTTASACLILFIGFYSSAKEVLETRYSPESNGRSYYTYKVYKNAKKDLNDWGVTPNDTLAFIDVSSTNIPFTLFKKKGYSSLSSGKESFQRIMENSFDYAFLLDSFKVSDSYFDYPKVAEQLKFIAGNGELSMYEKSASSDPHQFFKQLFYRLQSDFESNHSDTNLNLGAPIEEVKYRQGKVLAINSDNEFALTSTIKLPSTPSQSDIRIVINTEFFALDSAKGLQLIFSLPPYYFAYYLESELKENKEWEKKTFIRRIPEKYIQPGSELKIYFWNPNKTVCYLDNYHLIVYE